MHDTNTRNLFADHFRFDSPGCPRVDNIRDRGPGCWRTAGLNLPHDASRLGLLEALADAAADSLG